MTEWFEEWFGEEYLHLYPHRDDEDADRLVRLIADRLALPPETRVLDVACGAGRHARAFEQLGFRTVGLDLSSPLLARARSITGAPLVRADMRHLPVRPRSLDLVVNLFTSFGYFDDDRDHEAALAAMIEAVRPGGWFVIDFLNASWVRETLVPEEHAVVAGTEVRIERWLHDRERYVMKTISVPDGRQFVERVRLLEPAELRRMIERHGAVVEHQLGSYDGAPASTGAPRAIIMAKAA